MKINDEQCLEKVYVYPTEFYEDFVFKLEHLNGKVGKMGVESDIEDGIKYTTVVFLEENTNDWYVIATLEEEV